MTCSRKFQTKGESCGMQAARRRRHGDGRAHPGMVFIFQVYDTFPFQVFLVRYFKNYVLPYEMDPYAYTFVREIRFCDMVVLFQVLAEVCGI
jgi:hypothetical protein